MKAYYSAPLAHKLVSWAKCENSHRKALKIITVADKTEERWLKHEDPDVARWRSTPYLDINENTK